MSNKKTEIRTVSATFYKGMLGDYSTEWWTQEDWDNHNKFVEEYKADGTYGDPIDVEISFIPDPTFDEPKAIKGTIGDYRMGFIDLNKYNEK